MKRSMLRNGAILGLLVLFTASLTAQDQKKYTFKWKVPSVGETMGMQMKMTMDNETTVKMDGEVMQSMSMSMKNDEKREIEVLATDGKSITKIKVKYLEMSQEMDAGEMEGMPGMPETGENLAELVGNTYIVELVDGAPKVTDEAGEAVADSVAQTVKEQEVKDGRFTTWSPILEKIIPTRPISVGETFTIKGADAKELMPMGDGPGDLGDLSVDVTFSGTKKILGTECGVFDVKVNMGGAPVPGLELKGVPTGQMVVGVDNMWLYQMKLNGDMTMGGSPDMGDQPAPVDISIDATIKIKADGMALYGKKK